MFDITVVVPVYRNALTLEPLCDQLAEVLSGLGLTFEILLINDASPDDSLARLKSIAARRGDVTILDLARNHGQHAAILLGLAHARGAVCAIMDADLQDRPASLAALWQARAPRIAAIFGGRRGRYQSRGRHATSRLFKWVLHRMTGLPADAGVFILLERPLVDALVGFRTRIPWIPAMIGCLGVPVISVPVARDARREGRSAYGWFGRLRTGVKGVFCVLEQRTWPPARPYLTSHHDRSRARIIAAALSPRQSALERALSARSAPRESSP